MMRKIDIKKIITCFILLWSCMYAQDQNNIKLFWQGNKLYKQEDMTAALAAYNGIAEKGYSVWYNMGNCAYYVQDYAHAILYWRRAQNQAKSLSEFDDVQHNIVLARIALGLPEHQNMILFQLTRLSKVFSPFIIQLLFIVCLCVLFVYARAWVAARRFWILACTIICWVLLSIVVLLHYNEQKLRGIIIGQNTTLYGSAHNQSALGTVALGQEVTIKQQKAEWYKIVGQSAEGWIPAHDIEIM